MPANEQDTQTDEIQSNASEKQIEEEPLRPFTDYIEEFRQKEVQYGSLLEGSQVEPFSALMPDEGPGIYEFASSWTNTPLGDSILLGEIPIAVEDVESHSENQIVLPVGENGNDVEEPAGLQVQSASEAEEALPAVGETSPLLLPSSRVRLPRQAGLRHREEPEVEGQIQQEQNSETTIGITPTVEEAGTVDENPVEEKPRPERRYRFDRRTPTASTIATTTQPRRRRE